MGLLAAFSYEVAILRSASRLTAADAFRQLHALYRERTHPLSPPLRQPDAGQAGRSGAGAAQCPLRWGRVCWQDPEEAHAAL